MELQSNYGFQSSRFPIPRQKFSGFRNSITFHGTDKGRNRNYIDKVQDKTFMLYLKKIVNNCLYCFIMIIMNDIDCGNDFFGNYLEGY